VAAVADPGDGTVDGIDRTAKLYVGGKQARPDGGYSGRSGRRRGGFWAMCRWRTARMCATRSRRRRGRRAGGRPRGICGRRSSITWPRTSRRGAEFAGRLRDDDRARRAGGGGGVGPAAVHLGGLGRQVRRAGEGRADPRDRAGDERAGGGDRGDLPGRGAASGARVDRGAGVAMGNRVVAVASEPFPLAATDFYQVLDTSDVPGGVVNILTGSHRELAPQLAGHMDVDAVWCFSSRTSRGWWSGRAPATLKRTWVNDGRARDWPGARARGASSSRRRPRSRRSGCPTGSRWPCKEAERLRRIPSGIPRACRALHAWPPAGVFRTKMKSGTLCSIHPWSNILRGARGGRQPPRSCVPRPAPVTDTGTSPLTPLSAVSRI
jgi:aldehyde dehydrogenase (NAD+)